MLIYLSLRLYTYMGFWISTSQGKLRYLDHAPMNFICIGSQWNLALLVLALVITMDFHPSPHPFDTF